MAGESVDVGMAVHVSLVALIADAPHAAFDQKNCSFFSRWIEIFFLFSASPERNRSKTLLSAVDGVGRQVIVILVGETNPIILSTPSSSESAQISGSRDKSAQKASSPSATDMVRLSVDW